MTALDKILSKRIINDWTMKKDVRNYHETTAI